MLRNSYSKVCEVLVEKTTDALVFQFAFEQAIQAPAVKGSAERLSVEDYG